MLAWLHSKPPNAFSVSHDASWEGTLSLSKYQHGCVGFPSLILASKWIHLAGISTASLPKQLIYLSKIYCSKTLWKLQEARYAASIQTLFDVCPVCIGCTDRHRALREAGAGGHILSQVEADFEVHRKAWAAQAHDPVIMHHSDGGNPHDVRTFMRLLHADG